MERLVRVATLALMLAVTALLSSPLFGQGNPKPGDPNKKKATVKKGLVLPGLDQSEPAQPANPPKKVDPADKLRPNFSAQVSLPTNPDLERKLKAVPEYIGVKAWKEVTGALQEILDFPEDSFMPRDNKGAAQWVSIKSEASRLLGSLPADGKKVYEVAFGGTAAALLQEGKENGDLQKLADVAFRYMHTQAGGEALDLLGTYHLDKGRYLMAAMCFERLLHRQEAEQLSPLSLFKATLAFKRNRDLARVAELWKTLEEKAKDGLVVGKRKATLEELKKIIDLDVSTSGGPLAATDWTMFRGNQARTGLAATQPLDAKSLTKGWATPTVELAYSRSWVDNAMQRLSSMSRPIVAGAAPVSAGGKVIVRTQRGVRALDPKTGALAWETPDFNFGFDSIGPNSPNAKSYPHISGWVENVYLSNFPSVLIENTSYGSLSSDGKYVYALEEMAVPPYPQNVYNPNMPVGIAFRNPQPNAPSGESADLARALKHNQLVAMNAITGRMEWMVGGISEKNPGPLDEAFFLGTPMPLAGRLYSLIEKDSELKLVCLDPSNGSLLWSQSLINYKKSMQQEPGRRAWAAPMAYDQGILVCPSNSGAVVGVDLLTHSLVWAHAYVEAPKPEVQPPVVGKGVVRRPIMRYTPPKMDATWKAAGPIIADGKVIITAPDAATIQCLNLRDGSLVWKRDKLTDDHFVAGVHKDKVIIVGQSQVRAISLKNGQDLWQSATGMPSGQGVTAGKVHYLPVRSEPGIVGIDLDNGNIAVRIATPGSEVPGNLVLTNGRLLSQTPTGVTVYSLTK